MLTEYYADYKWIKVKRYVDDTTLTWEDRYKKLESHHEKETTFLINEIRKLAAVIDDGECLPEGSGNRSEKD